MSENPNQPVECAAAWRGPELAASDDWIHVFSDAEVVELEAALDHVKRNNIPLHDITREDFPLPTLAATLGEILDELEYGRGMAVLRGIPVARLGNADTTIIYWGIGTYLGKIVAQNMMGELLGDVQAIGGDWEDNFNLRGYQMPVHLPFHCDKSDVVGLLCLQTAKSGGLSSISSSVAIHNEILRTRPDLLEVLYRPFCIDHRGEEFDGEDPFYVAPTFAMHGGRLYARYGAKYVESAQRFPQVPRLTDQELDAMALFNTLARSDAFRLDMQFQRGDIQLLNNHFTVHSRTDYEDYDELARKRHLLRMLLFTPSYTDVPQFAQDLNNFIRRWGDFPRQSVLDAG
jgi:hypothetical protein